MTCQFFIPSFQEETFSYNEEIHLKIAEYKTKAANVYIFFYTVIVKCFIRIQHVRYYLVSVQLNEKKTIWEPVSHEIVQLVM